MDTIHVGIQYFEIYMECLRCFFESFYDFLGIFGYIVAFLEFITCYRIVLELLAVLEWKLFGTDFHSVQRYIFKLMSRKIVKNYWAKFSVFISLLWSMKRDRKWWHKKMKTLVKWLRKYLYKKSKLFRNVKMKNEGKIKLREKKNRKKNYFLLF